jgi:hypothetical protein
MVAAEQKYSRERGRTRRAELCFVLSLICLMAFRPGLEDNAINLTQVSFADIIPSPPGPDVVIAGPSPRSRLGGSGQPDNLQTPTVLKPSPSVILTLMAYRTLPSLPPDAELIVRSTIRRAGAVYIIFGRRDFPSVIDTAKAQPGGSDVTILGVADGDRFGFALAAGDIKGMVSQTCWQARPAQTTLAASTQEPSSFFSEAIHSGQPS